MKLKTAVRIVEYSNLAILLGALIALISFIAKQKNDQFNFLLLAFSLPFILSFFFRKLLVNIILKRSKYPGVFYSVLDKMHLAENLEIDLTDDLLNEIHKPHYSTNEYLKDNNLKTEIGRSKLRLPVVLLILASGLVGLILLNQKFSFQEKPFAFIALIGLIILNLFLIFKEKKQKNDISPILRFEEKGLFIHGFYISWKDIFDWEYNQGSKSSNATILLNYYNQDKLPADYSIVLSELNTTQLDVLMLLTHFKGKFGAYKSENSSFVQV